MKEFNKDTIMGIAKKEIKAGEWIHFDSHLNSNTIKLTPTGKDWLTEKIFEKAMKDFYEKISL